MAKTTVLAVLYDFVLHEVAGNVVAGLVLLSGTAAWQHVRARRQARSTDPGASGQEEPPS